MQDLSVSKSLKVLFLSEWYPGRNDPFHGLFVHNHAKAISEYCNTTVIYAAADKNLTFRKFEIENIHDGNLKIIRVYFKIPVLNKNFFYKLIKILRYYSALYKGLKYYQKENGRPHIIHANIVGKSSSIAFILKKIKKIPYVVTEHWTGYLPHSGKFKGYFKKYYTKLIIKNADTITTVSENLKNCMLHQNLKGNYEVVPNVIKAEIRTERKYPDKVIALNISDLVDDMKNVSGLVKAVPEIISFYPQFELHILGEGPHRNKLESLSAGLNLLNRHVFFFNYIPHEKVYEKIASSSFLAVNSRYETFSVVAAEALACGVPVLTTRCGGPEEFINNENGRVIEPDDHEQLVEGIKWMCENYKSFNEEKLKLPVKNKFSERAVAQKFVSIYLKYATKWKAGNSENILNINPAYKVLDVGSGNRPNERANVLLERELDETEHRSGTKAVIPEWKNIVVGDALNMPFGEKEFDFVIASHIAEHIENPDLFCRELSRVGKRGYIETPGKLSEFFFNEPFHKWIVYNKKNTLVFKEKKKFNAFNEFFYRFFYLNSERYGHKPLHSHSKLLIKLADFLRRIWRYLPYSYTKFFWKDSIKYKVIK